jgi:hypothetical protein
VTSLVIIPAFCAVPANIVNAKKLMLRSPNQTFDMRSLSDMWVYFSSFLIAS